MNKLLEIINDFERQNLPCRYTLTPGDNVLWLAVKVSSASGDKIFDYSLPPISAIDELETTLKNHLPHATVCTIEGRLLIDNLK